MTDNRWIYYNRALIPAFPETDKFDCITYNEAVRESNVVDKPLFVLYPVDFDCGDPTLWWYTINDKGYDIASLSAKRRYEINKGSKNFVVKKIDPKNYIDEIVEIEKRSFDVYPVEYRPDINGITNEWLEAYLERLYKKNVEHEFFGAYNSEGKMCGFIHIEKRPDKVVNLSQQKVIPAFEKMNVNFALLHFVLSRYNDDIKSGKIVFSNGQRNIRHKTAFNDFLCKYFGFRKAYARLRIEFPPFADLGIKLFARLCPQSILDLEYRNKYLYSVVTILKYVKISQSSK